MFPNEFLAPIPAPAEQDWERVSAPVECGEPLVDPTGLSPKITFGAAYRSQGLPGTMDRCLLRLGVAQRLVLAAEKLPEGWSILIFDALRPWRFSAQSTSSSGPLLLPSGPRPVPRRWS